MQKTKTYPVKFTEKVLCQVYDEIEKLYNAIRPYGFGTDRISTSLAVDFKDEKWSFDEWEQFYEAYAKDFNFAHLDYMAQYGAYKVIVSKTETGFESVVTIGLMNKEDIETVFQIFENSVV